MNEAPKPVLTTENIMGVLELSEIDSKHPAFDRILNHVKKVTVSIALQKCRGNQTQVANLLGINRGTLRKMIKQYGL